MNETNQAIARYKESNGLDDNFIEKIIAGIVKDAGVTKEKAETILNWTLQLREDYPNPPKFNPDDDPIPF